MTLTKVSLHIRCCFHKDVILNFWGEWTVFEWGDCLIFWSRALGLLSCIMKLQISCRLNFTYVYNAQKNRTKNQLFGYQLNFDSAQYLTYSPHNETFKQLKFFFCLSGILFQNWRKYAALSRFAFVTFNSLILYKKSESMERLFCSSCL